MTAEELNAEISKISDQPPRLGALIYKDANAWVEQARKRPNPVTYFHGMIVAEENTVLFAASNLGKSILAVQIADEISRTAKVFYIDLEMSDKQFQMRYTDGDLVHIFPDNFVRAELRPELLLEADLEESILDSIELVAKQGVKVVILDNLTFACINAEKAESAGEFMKKIIFLKNQYKLTLIVVAHTPKLRGYNPLSQYDLAGSAKLVSLFDAGIAIGRSAKDTNLRYLKQVKVRTGEYIYDEDNVIVCELMHSNGWLHFEIRGYECESDHLKVPIDSYDEDQLNEVQKLKGQGLSYREIAQQTGLSLGGVQRRLKKLETVSGVSVVSDVSDTIQPIQTELEL